MKKLFITLIYVSLVYSCLAGNTSNVIRFIDRETLDELLPDIITYFKTNSENVLSDSVLRQHYPNTEIHQDEDGTIRCNDELLVVTKRIDNNHMIDIGIIFSIR